MKKLKLALIGSGKLNDIIANALEEGYLPEYELVGVFGRNVLKTEDFAKRHNCEGCTDIQELMDLKPDYIAEAASPQAVRDYCETVLKGGSNLVVLSIGAFADEEFYNKMAEVGRQNSKKIYIASGAVGGFDVLRTAALMSPIKAKMTSKREIDSLEGTPLHKEHFKGIKEPEQAFFGTAKEAFELLPNQLNVAVATALASAGPKDTSLKIDVVPGFEGDEYKIEVEGEEVKLDLNIYSKTSDIAAWSVVATLRNILSPIEFQ